MGIIQDEKIESKRYELEKEYVIYKNKKTNIIKLTFDNVARVEAMIGTDSDYKNSSNINSGMIMNNKGKIKYIGSSAFWFNQLKQITESNTLTNSSKYSYDEIITNVIIAIDNENSTHLNSDNIGREAVKERLLKIDRKKL